MKWTLDETDIMRMEYSTSDIDDLAQKLNRSPSAVIAKASAMGLYKRNFKFRNDSNRKAYTLTSLEAEIEILLQFMAANITSPLYYKYSTEYRRLCILHCQMCGESIIVATNKTDYII